MFEEFLFEQQEAVDTCKEMMYDRQTSRDRYSMWLNIPLLNIELAHSFSRQLFSVEGRPRAMQQLNLQHASPILPFKKKKKKNDTSRKEVRSTLSLGTEHRWKRNFQMSTFSRALIFLLQISHTCVIAANDHYTHLPPPHCSLKIEGGIRGCEIKIM